MRPARRPHVHAQAGRWPWRRALPLAQVPGAEVASYRHGDAVRFGRKRTPVLAIGA